MGYHGKNRVEEKKIEKMSYLIVGKLKDASENKRTNGLDTSERSRTFASVKMRNKIQEEICAYLN